MRILRELLLLVLLTAGVGAGVFAVWYWWPASSSNDAQTRQHEKSLLGRAEDTFREHVREQVSLDAVRDPEVTQVTSAIQARLAPSVGHAPYAIEIFVVDSATVNAVCLPGAIIVVYSGLIRRLESPEELAAILAHESAHAVHRDAMQALKREVGMAALLSLMGGGQDALTGRLLQRLISTGFSRQQELAADKDALRVLGASGIDPGALAQALRHIKPAAGEDLRVLQYVSTHPGLDERVQLAEAAAADWDGKVLPLQLDWAAFKARFRFLR
ncbi:MAG: M48 family metallopeptidase [Polyangiaceae bacterium]|nr:M48 family metallopeptidase [Polyangiaceae bacterium]